MSAGQKRREYAERLSGFYTRAGAVTPTEQMCVAIGLALSGPLPMGMVSCTTRVPTRGRLQGQTVYCITIQSTTNRDASKTKGSVVAALHHRDIDVPVEITVLPKIRNVAVEDATTGSAVSP